VFLPILTDTFWAIIWPPITARPVQRAWRKICVLTRSDWYLLSYHSTSHNCQTCTKCMAKDSSNCDTYHILQQRDNLKHYATPWTLHLPAILQSVMGRTERLKWQVGETQIIQDYAQISSDGVWSVQLQETNIIPKIHSKTLLTLYQKYWIVYVRNWQDRLACTNVHMLQVITLCNCIWLVVEGYSVSPVFFSMFTGPSSAMKHWMQGHTMDIVITDLVPVCVLSPNSCHWTILFSIYTFILIY
jgi:hypothetical protein